MDTVTRTDSTADVQVPAATELEQFFRGRVPGDPDRWAAAWGSWADLAEERRAYSVDYPDEWPAEVKEITTALRKGMGAGRVVKPSGAKRELGEGVASDQLGAHQTARAHTLAEHAANDPTVQSFRALWLPDGLRITDDEVRAWVAEHRGPVSVPWTTEQGERGVAELGEAAGHGLAGLVRLLASTYRWEPELAAAFVLTGATPHAPMLRVRPVVRYGGMTGTASDLITLRVHPDVPAGEVEAAYRAAQAKHWGTRAHLISDRVAEAVTRSVAVGGGSAAQNAMMTRPYADGGDFRRTVERAKQRLMGDPAPLTVADFRRAFGAPVGS